MDTMKDLINQQATDAATVSTDTATIAADQAKLVNDQAQLGTDQVTQKDHAATLDAKLLLSGPVGALSPDGQSVEIFAAAGTVIQPNVPYPLASSVPIPADPTADSTPFFPSSTGF
jgi:hypothetical protein